MYRRKPMRLIAVLLSMAMIMSACVFLYPAVTYAKKPVPIYAADIKYVFTGASNGSSIDSGAGDRYGDIEGSLENGTITADGELDRVDHTPGAGPADGSNIAYYNAEHDQDKWASSMSGVLDELKALKSSSGYHDDRTVLCVVIVPDFRSAIGSAAEMEEYGKWLKYQLDGIETVTVSHQMWVSADETEAAGGTPTTTDGEYGADGVDGDESGGITISGAILGAEGEGGVVPGEGGDGITIDGETAGTEPGMVLKTWTTTEEVVTGPAYLYQWQSGESRSGSDSPIYEGQTIDEDAYDSLTTPGDLEVEGDSALADKIYCVSFTSACDQSGIEYSGKNGKEWNKDIETANGILKGQLPSPTKYLDLFDVFHDTNVLFKTSGGSAAKMFRYRASSNLQLYHIIKSNVMEDNPLKEPEDAIPTSLYAVSTALTSYANSVFGDAPGAEHEDGELNELVANSDDARNAGNAGAFLGYGDPSKEFRDSMLTAGDSKSSTVTLYENLLKVKPDTKALYTYARYGHLLSDLGLDKTGNPVSVISGRMVPGVILLLFYWLSALAPMAFGFVISVLKLLNPFSLLKDATEVVLPSTIGDYSSALQPVATLFSDVYDTLHKFSTIVVIPMFFIILIVSLLLWNSSKRAQALSRGKSAAAVRTFLVRLFVIVLCVPILGELYTMTLDTAGGMVKQHRNMSTQMVAATFIDFHAWAQGLRLDPQAEMVSKGASTDPGGSATDTTWQNLRSTVVTTNMKAGAIPGGDVALGMFGTALVSSSSSAPWASTASSGNYISGMPSSIYDQLESDLQTKMMGSVTELLRKYLMGEMYFASTWESALSSYISTVYKSELGRQSGLEEDEKTVKKNEWQNENFRATVLEMYDSSNEFADWDGRKSSDNKVAFSYNNDGPAPRSRGSDADDGDPKGMTWTRKEFNIFDNGYLKHSTSGRGLSSAITYKPSGSIRNGDGVNPSVDGGLSTMSLYNYLNTSFENARTMTEYSAERVASDYARTGHYSVNMIGSGIMGVLYYMNCFGILLAFTILGVGIALRMAFNNVKRSITLVATIPGAALGVLKSIGQFIVVVIMMIAELLGAVIMFSIGSELFYAIVTIFESQAKEAVTASVIGGVFADISSATGLSIMQVLIVNLILLSVVTIVSSIWIWIRSPKWVEAWNRVMYRVYSRLGLPDCENAQVLSYVPAPVVLAAKETAAVYVGARAGDEKKLYSARLHFVCGRVVICVE